MKTRSQSVFVGVLVLLWACRAVADDVPLKNWQVPVDEFRKQLDLTQPVIFVGIEPCRLVDTRPSQGFPPAWGPPALVMNATRDFDLDSSPNCTGIPTSVAAYSLNVTVAEPAGPGDLRVWPTGNPPLVATSIMNWSGSGASFAIANAVIMPAGGNGAVTVQMAGTSGHLIIDINGYFTDRLSPGVGWLFTGQRFGSVLQVQNLEPVFALSLGIFGRTGSGGANSFGIVGENFSFSSSEVGGVRGSHGMSFSMPFYGPTGVRGESLGAFGVLGVGQTNFALGVAGSNVSAGGAETTWGALACGDATAVCGLGFLSITALSSFVEPHPSNASKVIKYVSLEGNEAGTYFRGRGKFERGLARIRVPEDFRMVTGEEGLSIQVTPIGEMASVAVVRIGLEEIVVKGSRNVEFFYTVNGLRKGYEDFTPIVEESFFVPRSAEYRMPGALSVEAKRKLIANGTYNEDGSVNMETAKRLGWTEKWKGESPSR